MSDKSILNQDHEAAFEQQAAPQQPRPAALGNRILQFLLRHLVSNDELQIWQERDRFGNTWWYAFDPKSNRSLVFSTEEEARIWLEQVLYR